MALSCLKMPICSMYGIFTYIWVIFGANVGKYSSTMEHIGNCFEIAKVPCRGYTFNGWIEWSFTGNTPFFFTFFDLQHVKMWGGPVYFHSNHF